MYHSKNTSSVTPTLAYLYQSIKLATNNEARIIEYAIKFFFPVIILTDEDDGEIDGVMDGVMDGV